MPFVPPRAFSSPAYWAAVGVLLLNDHVWKGAGVLPAWLTGKLSDFAGMLVAPPIAAALVGLVLPRVERARPWLASGLVGLAFAAIKLDAGCAAWAVSLCSAVGVSNPSIVVDPTDLLALIALPWAASSCRPQTVRAARTAAAWSRSASLGAQRVGLAVASFACIASFGSDDEGSGSNSDAPSLLNASEETVIVHIASTDGAGGCRLYRDDRVGVLTPDAFAARREVALKANESAQLASSDADITCGAAWISLSDGTEERVYWRDLAKLEDFLPDDDGSREARRVTLRGQTNRFRFELGDELSQLEPSDEPVGSNCADDAPEFTVEASALAIAPGFYELGVLERDADGCLPIEWFTQDGEAADTQRLCVPDWAFPFEDGETLSVTESVLDSGERRLRITRYDEGAFDQELTIWNGGTVLDGAPVLGVTPVDCVGRVSECGAYVRPVELELPGDHGVLTSGDEADWRAKTDDFRVLLGLGRDVGWTAPACSGDEARVGTTINFLELRTN